MTDLPHVPYPEQVGALPLRWPAEWEPQSRVWVGWPRLAEEWGGQMDLARREIADFVDALVQFVPVRIAVGDDASETVARAMLPEAAEIVRVPMGDIWLRDTGPLVVETGGQFIAQCFRFNGWGGKFEMPGDRETGRAIADAEGLGVGHQPFILEGGAIEGDGAGNLLTTRECLLGGNRNGWTEADANGALAGALGMRRVVWLDRGLIGDHTDGHVDNIARFIGPGRVLCQSPFGRDDPHADRLAEIEAALRGGGFEVETIVSPGRVTSDTGEILPASHMNFTLTNGAVLVPIYGGDAGEAARRQLEALFPGRTVIALSARAILEGGGGAFHCMTCHIPGPRAGADPASTGGVP